MGEKPFINVSNESSLLKKIKRSFASLIFFIAKHNNLQKKKKAKSVSKIGNNTTRERERERERETIKLTFVIRVGLSYLFG
jgi:hypothetical protein